MKTNTDILGYIATGLLNTALIWQNIQSWNSKSTSDISLYWTIQFNAGLLFIIYGIKINSKPLIYGTSIELLLIIGILIAKLIYK